MRNREVQLTRADKILLTLYRLARGTKKKVRFEDIAVSAFKTFPQDFQLKGYPKYPDTGDIIHKPLYSELKKRGYVLSGNKYFSLTQKGIDRARFLDSNTPARTRMKEDAVKFTPAQREEIENILKSSAYSLFKDGKKEEILDIDFYNYLGVTVRTDKYDFLGRLNNVEDAVSAVGMRSYKVGKELEKLHEFLMNKFKSNVDYFRQRKGGRQ